MAQRPAASQHGNDATRTLDGGFWLVVAMAVVLGIMIVVSAIAGAMLPSQQGPTGGVVGAAISPAASPAVSTAADPSSFLYPVPRAAPPIELTDPDESPFTLTSLRGEPVLVFFGYTHCPDVCPATVGTVGLAMEAFGSNVRAVYVSVDPERDTPVWLKEYVRFLPAGFVAVTGKGAQIRATADAWDVRYAKVEAEVPGAYSMAHTADVYLVDPDGMLRAHFPFGTSSEAMAETLRTVVESAALTPPSSPTAAPSTPAPTVSTVPARPTAVLDVEVISSSVWAGGETPLILALSVDGQPLDDAPRPPEVQLVTPDGTRIGGPAAAIPVRPTGVTAVSYVATLDIPTPGSWRIEVTASSGDASAVESPTAVGYATVDALDPGATAGLGTAAPTIATPTLGDVGGVARAVTTDPAPDLRLSQRSTADALAAHQSFVLVVDSARFQTTQACGRAIVMARHLVDRWQDVAFIHLEPFRYSVVADTAVLEGTIDRPFLTQPTLAWGIGGEPWPAVSMPWIFVVDGDGVVRAKYQGVMGTSDVDVMLALIAQGD